MLEELFPETNVQLSPEHAAEFKQLLALEENKEIRVMETTWLGKAESKGEARGIKKANAQAVETMRQAVLQGLEQRFGTIPRQVRRRLEMTRSLERLAGLVEKLMSAGTVDDLVALGRATSASSH